MIPSDDREQEERWTEHFREIPNKPPPEEDADIPEAADDLDINTARPEKEEIIKASKSLKNGEAHDNLNTEFFKADPELAATVMQPLFAAIWEGGEVPADWTKGVIRITKKGALSDCNNWRGITLLSVPSKILAKIVIKRISDAVDAGMRKEQAGFGKERGCTDHITLRNITEQCTESQRQLYINFVDFEKAFDSIHRDSLRRILRAYGIALHIVQIIKSYLDFTCIVGSSSLNSRVKTGMCHACVPF